MTDDPVLQHLGRELHERWAPGVVLLWGERALALQPVLAELGMQMGAAAEADFFVWDGQQELAALPAEGRGLLLAAGQDTRPALQALQARGWWPSAERLSVRCGVVVVRPGAPSPEAVIELGAGLLEQRQQTHTLQQSLLEREHSLESARAEAAELRAQLQEMTGTDAWRLLSFVRERRHLLLPEGSLRQRWIHFASRRLAKRLGGVPAQLPFEVEALRAAGRPRVLILSGCGGDSRRYRCAHLIESLARLGGHGELLDWPTPLVASHGRALAELFDLVILQRAPLDGALKAFIEDRLRPSGIPVLFETDDLLFDPELAIHGVPGLTRMVDRDKLMRQHAALRCADAALCTTAFLQARIERMGVKAHVLRNGFSEAMRRAAELALAERRARGPRPVIGYASGTPTHDRDFAQAEPALARILARFPAVQLHLVGHLQPGPRLASYRARIRRLPFVHWSALPRLLRGFSLNLAPLDVEHDFCHAKSELKFLEAALVAVPTVASNTQAFAHAIEHNVDGCIAGSADDWFMLLSRLISDPALRERLGTAARAKVLREYSLQARARELSALFLQLGVPGA